MAIQSFSDNDTEIFFKSGKLGKGVRWANVSRIARRKLDMLHYAIRLSDLRAPPGNKLEALKGDLIGYHSIRINEQYRICFVWAETEPDQVEIVDYH